LSTDGSVDQMRGNLAERLFCSNDHAGNFGPFVDQYRHDVAFHHQTHRRLFLRLGASRSEAEPGNATFCADTSSACSIVTKPKLHKLEFFAIFDDWILSIRRVCFYDLNTLGNAVEAAAIAATGIISNFEIVLIG
jgi:hypothetical protein